VNAAADPCGQTPELGSTLLLLAQDETRLAPAKLVAPSPNSDIVDTSEFTLQGATPISHLDRCPRALFSKLHLGQVRTWSAG